MYKRVLLKISGEALSSDKTPLCAETIDQTAEDIAYLHAKGVEVGVVTGGGNILRGRSSGNMERNRADHMGMLATAINSLALQDALERKGIPCVVLSAADMPKFCDSFTSRAAHKHLAEKTVVLFACGTGSPFFSTDTAAVLKAAEIGADAILLAKNIDGVYSADPRIDPSAVKYDRISYDDILARHLEAMDSTATSLSMDNHIPVILFALEDPQNIIRVVSGEKIGTIVG